MNSFFPPVPIKSFVTVAQEGAVTRVIPAAVPPPTVFLVARVSTPVVAQVMEAVAAVGTKGSTGHSHDRQSKEIKLR